jgi:hypothetical protein
LYRGINDFKKGYQPINNTVQNKEGYLVTDSHSILARWRNHSFQLLNVHGVNGVRQTEMYTAEPAPQPSNFEVEKKSHKSPGSDQIPAELKRQRVEQSVMRSKYLLLLFEII